MATYVIATVNITDPERFALYAKGIAGLSEKFGGESVARGAVSGVIVGDSSVGERIVISRYPDEASARAYFASPEYQSAAVHRDASATATIRLMND